MTAKMRVGIALLAGVLAGGLAAQASAQVPGMPLFTNPRYATGLRVHLDAGQPTEAGTNFGDATVIQGGVTFALGPIGIGANVGALNKDWKNNQGCIDHPSLDCDLGTKYTASALGQIRVAGGGRSNLSLSLFGGASMDVTSLDFVSDAQRDSLVMFGIVDAVDAKELTIPLGAAIGLRIPLGLASLNLWGAPRMNLTRFVSCTGTCPDGTSRFRWAVGADLPIFRIVSVRAAYDSGDVENAITGRKETVAFWGIGASIGIGGMR